MTAPACPHCGADTHTKSIHVYECGTGAHPNASRKDKCYQRQLAAKDEEIQRVLAANKDCIAWFEDARDEAIKLKQQLSDLKELCWQVAYEIRARGNI